MMARQGPSFILKQRRAEVDARNKKEVKTTSFSPPGVGGVLHDNTLRGSAGLPCQAGLRPHSRLFSQFVRRLTTKELVFPGFVAPQRAGVNDKKVNESIRKNADFRSILNPLKIRQRRY